MAEIHRKKPLKSKRMTHFKLKAKKESKTKGVISTAKRYAYVAHKGLTGPTAKKIGSGIYKFFKGWGEATAAKQKR